MTLNDTPLYCREALAVLGIFQRLGVDSVDIFFMPKRSTDGFYPAIVAVLANGKSPAWEVSIFGRAPTSEQLVREWLTAANLWNGLPQTERRQFVDSSRSRIAAVDFLSLCAVKGITFKRDPLKALDSE